ncbi:RNA polymerase sigma factor [Sphingobium sp. CFD-2]|uniref:RNA polymerase sigma factor n=1 Tax=Sphingobium sp. CFD-2 TaxID=2878542 RepID=UPI00214CDE81|nr:sigma-70 family RNA polymerase sigma factor [Sphingobium sp. CFD-2]
MTERRCRTAARKDAAAALDRRFRSPLLTYFRRRLGDQAEAEDLTQEVFIRLATHPDRHDGTKLRSYVFTIAANLLRDKAKSASSAWARQIDSLDKVDAGFARPRELVDGLTPERLLVGKETLAQVRSAMFELSEKTRYIFALSRLDKMRYQDIAALYGISVSAVEKHIIKANAHLGARHASSHQDDYPRDTRKSA